MPQSTLQDLTPNDWTLFESQAKRIDFKLGEEIIKEGVRVDRLYVSRNGFGRARRNDLSRGDCNAQRGDVCGEMAFLGNSTATAAVVAKDEIQVDAIWVDDLRQLITTFSGFGMRLYR